MRQKAELRGGTCCLLLQLSLGRYDRNLGKIGHCWLRLLLLQITYSLTGQTACDLYVTSLAPNANLPTQNVQAYQQTGARNRIPNKRQPTNCYSPIHGYILLVLSFLAQRQTLSENYLHLCCERGALSLFSRFSPLYNVNKCLTNFFRRLCMQEERAARRFHL